MPVNENLKCIECGEETMQVCDCGCGLLLCRDCQAEDIENALRNEDTEEIER